MKFIVIEGLDGSGKSTQVKLLEKYFTNKSIPYKFLHFPRADSPVYGDLIARFLRGELGTIHSVNPYLVALIYAGDRNNAKDLINRWLNEGYLVIVDRYVYSNIAFQCAKLQKQKERKQLSTWIKNLEFNFYNIPVPDLSIFLDVPFDFTLNKLTNEREGNDREYLQGKADIHEKNLEFQEKVRKVYLSLANMDSSFVKIDCASDEEKMLPPEDIFKKIIHALTSNNIVKIVN